MRHPDVPFPVYGDPVRVTRGLINCERKPPRNRGANPLSRPCDHRNPAVKSSLVQS